MKESLLHSAFRYNDIALVKRLRQRADFEKNLLEKNDEGKTCVDLAYQRQGCIEFIPPEFILLRLNEAQLSDYLWSNKSSINWNHLAQKFNKSSFDRIINAATRSGHYQFIPHEFLLQIPSQHRYAALQIIETGQLDSLSPELAKLDLWMQTDHHGSLYHAAAHAQILDEIPQSVLTREGLMLRDSEGKTPVHLLAESGSGDAIQALFRRITWSFDWLLTDNLGNTVLHEAASSCHLPFLPEEALSEATMSSKRHDGLTPVDLAYIHKYFDTVPDKYKHFCFTKALYDMVQSAESGDWSWIDDHPECVELALDQIRKRQRVSNFLHVAALSQKLDLVPEKLIRKEILSITDSDGNSPLHLAASLGHLHYLPSKFSDPELFKLENANRENVADICFREGYITKIDSNLRPISWLYRKNYLITHIKNKNKNTLDTSQFEARDLAESPRPYSNHDTFSHWLAAEGRLGNLPNDYLLFVAQARPDGDGNSPLHVAALNSRLNLVPQTLLDPSALEARNHRDLNAVDLAFECGNILDLEPSLRCLSPLYRKSCLTGWILGRTPHDDPHFETADLIDSPHPNSDHHTFAHWLAAEGLLVKLPSKSIDGTVLGVPDSHGITPLHLLAARAEIQGLSNAAHLNHLLTKRDKSGTTPIHVAALHGTLNLLPSESLKECDFQVVDAMGRTPLHIAAEAGNLAQVPEAVFSNELLYLNNEIGETPLHLAARHPKFGGISISWFTKEFLLTKNHAGKSVADIIDESGNTPLLPPFHRKLSRAGALRRLGDCFKNEFIAAPGLHACEFAEVVPIEEFQMLRREFVLEWFRKYPDLALDEEQVEAVAEYGPHIQVIARAGSGKTRTLVARALFQITHCRIPASSILILAFNRKAVEEIHERLSKHLHEEQMPHVLTFHALAYRIVMPDEDLIYDEGETTEGQVFSTTIQSIIDDWMRGGSFESKLRALMIARWDSDLERIIALGFNLPQEQFLTHRANLLRTTMDGRRVDSEAHKHIGNSLLRLRLGYSCRRGIHRYAGEAYAPDFSHYNKETEHRFLIEVLGEEGAQANPARQAFWTSDRSTNAHLLQLNADDCQDSIVTLERVAKELASRGFSVSPMSDDDLWLTLRVDVIRNFTKAVRGFVSRCQKELISPDRLDGMLPDTDSDLWTIILMGGLPVRVLNVWGLQVRFWRLCSAIYRRYREVLAESHKTDFDQLMLDAAKMIREGRNGFKSARGSGEISQIKHLLIDEFQDFSHLFDELRKSIVNQSPEANFFCVGDDWQAINKFAGSDLRYFTGFRETFKPSVRKLITRNYRSCRKIVEIGNRVMDGHGEPSIPNSSEQGNIWRVEVGGLLNLTEAEEIVLDELGDDALAILRIASDCTSRSETVAILSRTNSVATFERMTKLEKWQHALRRYLPEKDRELLEVSTTHGFKGKEADVVILLDPEAYPFVHPDAIFATIFGDTFQSIEDDEKRLFYVGVTRPKKTLFLLSYPSRYSGTRPYEIKFLEGAYPEYFDINRLDSNLLCGSRVVVRLSNQRGYNKSSGTYPIKDRLKGAGYKWSEESNSWWRFLEEGSISSPFECRQFLQRQSWIPDANGILASFAWEDQQHRMVIVEGRVTPDGIAGQVPAEPRPAVKPPLDSIPKKIEAKLMPRQQLPIEPKQRIHPPVTPPTGVPSGVFETSIVGMKYDSRMEKARHLSIGDYVRLEREVGNTHDRNAIAVWTDGGVQIGYLSRHVATHLASALDAHGGIWDAKVSSVWKQPPPHFLVSIQISFKLPPGASIPAELGYSSSAADSPFDSPRPPSVPQTPVQKAPPPAPLTPKEPEATPPIPVVPQTPVALPQAPLPVSGSLTPAQDNELTLLGDPRLRPIITELYLSCACPWPVIGYEGQDSSRHCTDSMLEVAWPDLKIGIYMPTDNVTSFATTGWVILPAGTVSVEMLRSIMSSSTPCDAPESASNHYRNGPFLDEEPDDNIPF